MFFTKTPGIGGRIRQRIDDFVVEEIPINGSGLEEESHRLSPSEYTVFWLEKFNWDTDLALRTIAKRLHVSVKRFGIAGTKDKRALTRQKVSLWDPKNELLEKLKALKIKDMRLYGFERGGKIRIGDLRGNKFTITIRDVDMKKEEIRSRLNDIFAELSKGIPNLFGPQRFGEIRPLTHLVGREMLKGNFEKAVRLYLCRVFPKEREDAKKARRFLDRNWGKRGYLEALSLMPKRLKYERSMLDYLYKNPKDFVGALRRVPKRIRKMFLNAVQADIFNKIAKEIKAKKDRRKIRSKKIPLVGFDTILNEKNKIHKRIIEIMKEEGITQKDFLMRGMPELRCSGSERDLILKPKDMEIIKIWDDEYNTGKKAVKIKFELPAGSYASIVLKEIMKVEK